MRARSLRTLLLLLAGSLASAAGPAAAQVADTYVRLRAVVGDIVEQQELDGVPGAAADVQLQRQFIDGTSIDSAAHALAGGGGGTPEDPPIAECSADLAVIGVRTEDAKASSIFRYHARITGEPPSEIALFNPPVFVKLRYAGETLLEGDLSASFSSSAEAGVTIANDFSGTLVSEQVASTKLEPFGGFAGIETFRIDPWVREYPFAVVVRCSLQVAAESDGTVSAHALADPLFELDQAAYDEWAATSSGPAMQLAEHFGFEYSAAMAPEPDAAALALAALAVLSAGARRRRAA
jgi:hypothetical protein